MPKTTVVFTNAYTESGTSASGRQWTRTDFVTADGARFKTFDAAIASKAKGLLNVQVEVEYEIKERGQYVDNNLIDANPVAGAAPVAPAPVVPVTPEIKPVDRNAGLARAIEFVSVSGESILEAFDNGNLFELADTFAEYGALGAKPAALPPAAVEG